MTLFMFDSFVISLVNLLLKYDFCDKRFEALFSFVANYNRIMAVSNMFVLLSWQAQPHQKEKFYLACQIGMICFFPCNFLFQICRDFMNSS